MTCNLWNSDESDLIRSSLIRVSITLQKLHLFDRFKKVSGREVNKVLILKAKRMTKATLEEYNFTVKNVHERSIRRPNRTS